jgi:hypothetical protein
MANKKNRADNAAGCMSRLGKLPLFGVSIDDELLSMMCNPSKRLVAMNCFVPPLRFHYWFFASFGFRPKKNRHRISVAGFTICFLTPR